ncbi:MAG: PHP domain-containing protein [Gammaproteobacteria bacterium]
MRIDLHTHTTASDGTLDAAELLDRAQKAGIDMLAITDHDTVDGCLLASNSEQAGAKLIHGIELSTAWSGVGIHILGLNIDPGSPTITDVVAAQQQARSLRADEITRRLRKAGLACSIDAVKKLAGGQAIGRPHFARHLVDNGSARDIKHAFKKYLGPGKAGDVKNLWLPMERIIAAVLLAGGIPVLAHPAKYKLTNKKLNALLDDFCAAGGVGLEVISGAQSKDITQTLGSLCERREMLASCGSDFHQPGFPWSELGNFPPLPAHLNPIWESW